MAPARAGEAFRIWLLRRRHGVPLTLTLTVAGLEKLADVAALSLLVAPLPWILPQISAYTRPWLLALCVLPVLVAGAVVFLRSHPRWSKHPVLAGLRLFDEAGPVVCALACVLLAWLFDLATIELVLYGVGATPSLGAGLLVLLVTNLAIALPLTPGNVGAHELGSALALKMLGVPAETATAFALLYHGLHAIPVLLAGSLAGRRLFVELASEPKIAVSA